MIDVTILHGPDQRIFVTARARMPPMSISVPRIFGCESARRRSWSINGLTLSGLEWGAPGRPPLLCLHGGSAHAHWFDAVGPALADRYHVLSLDQRGHGESDWAPASPEGK